MISKSDIWIYDILFQINRISKYGFYNDKMKRISVTIINIEISEKSNISKIYKRVSLFYWNYFDVFHLSRNG